MSKLQLFVIAMLFLSSIFGFFSDWGPNANPIAKAGRMFGFAVFVTVLILIAKGAWILLGL